MVMVNKISHYVVKIEDEKNRINELLEESKYDVLDVPHLDMNEFCEKLIEEALDRQLEAMYSDLPPYEYVMKHFGIE